jgi:hypothetical protein
LLGILSVNNANFIEQRYFLVRIWSVDYASFREQGIFSVGIWSVDYASFREQGIFQWAFGRLIMLCACVFYFDRKSCNDC